jgi:iron(III) transport system permease protein
VTTLTPTRPATSRSPKPTTRWGRLVRPAIVAGALGLAVWLFAWPVAMLVVGIFREAPPGQPGGWSLRSVTETYTTPATYRALLNSVIYAVGVVLVGTTIGATFAFISTRTTIRLRGLLTPVMLLMMALPNLMYAVAWDQLVNPAGGLVNALVRPIFDSPSLSAESWPGLILASGLKLTGFAYFMLIGAFAQMDRRLEEASSACGAGRLRTLLTIDVPLMAPAVFGVMLVAGVFALGAFDFPQILGSPAGIPTLSTRIYAVLSSSSPDHAGAASIALLLVAALILTSLAQRRVMQGRSFVTVSGKGHAAERWNLGRAGNLGTAAIILFTVVALLAPGAQVVLSAFQPFPGVMTNLSLNNFKTVLADPLTGKAFALTAEMAVGCGFAVMLIAVLIAYLSQRVPRRVAAVFDVLTVLPIAMPGVVLSVGILWAYISIPGLRQLYATIWLCIIAVIVGVTPIASRNATGAVAQLGRELEEAAQTSGASDGRVLVQIVAPLLRRSFLAGWLVCGVIVAGSLDIPLLLLPAPSPNVATLVYGLLYGTSLPSLASAVLVLLMAAIFAIGLTALLLGALWRASRRRRAAATERSSLSTLVP